MTFRASNNRITVSDDSNRAVFDTVNKMPVITGILTGYLSWDALDWHDQYFVLGTVDPKSDFIFPTLRLNTTRNPAFPSGVPVSSPGSFLVAIWPTNGNYVGSAQIVTTVLQNGVVTLIKRGKSEEKSTITCEYKVYTGRFV